MYVANLFTLPVNDNIVITRQLYPRGFEAIKIMSQCYGLVKHFVTNKLKWVKFPLCRDMEANLSQVNGFLVCKESGGTALV